MENMIRLGPAGICTTAKEKTTIGSLRRIAELQLSSQEVEFVRGVKMSIGTAREVGKVAKELDIELSIHCPYYINLCSAESKKVEASKKRILDSVERAHAMHADIVVFHPAYYGKLSEGEAYQRVKEACEDMKARLKERGIGDVRLGLETTGKISQFGTLDEIVRICKEIKGCCVVVDWAHIYARNLGKIDFKEIFKKLSVLKLKHLHTHFSGIEFTKKGEKRHLNLTEGAKPDYKPLIKEILKRKIDITLISESPNLEGDALLFKRLLENSGYKF